MAADNPILFKVLEALKHAQAVAGNDNKDGVLAPGSKALRGFEDALGRTSFVHYAWQPKEKHLVLVCTGSLVGEDEPFGVLRQDRTRLPYFKPYADVGKPIKVNADILTMVEPLIGTNVKSPLLRCITAELDGALPERIIITGWQAGGAMATLLAPWLVLHFPAADVRLTTFDTPSVGNSYFVLMLQRMVSYSYRLVHTLEDQTLGGLQGMYTPTPVTVCIHPRDHSPPSATPQALKDLQALFVTLPFKVAQDVASKVAVVGGRRAEAEAGPPPLKGRELLDKYRLALETIPKPAKVEVVGVMDKQVLDKPTFKMAKQMSIARRATMRPHAHSEAGGPGAVKMDISACDGRPMQQRGTARKLPATGQAGADTNGEQGAHNVLPDLGDVGDTPYDEVDAMLNHSAENLQSVEHVLLLNKVRNAMVYSYAAYSDEEEFRSMTGLRNTRFLSDEEIDSQAHIAYRESDATVVVACRGTESVKDAKADAKFSKTQLEFLPSEFPGARTHFGFMEHFMSITKEDDPSMNLQHVIAELTDGKPIRRVLCCGHSLGGAMATLAAVWASLKYPQADVRCITCGSPRVGNNEFKQAFSVLVGSSIRLVYRSDPVPNMPFWGYRHVNHRIFLLQPNKATFGKRRAWWKWGMGLADHFVPGYTRTIVNITGEAPPSFCTDKPAKAAAKKAEPTKDFKSFKSAKSFRSATSEGPPSAVDDGLLDNDEDDGKQQEAAAKVGKPEICADAAEAVVGCAS